MRHLRVLIAVTMLSYGPLAIPVQAIPITFTFSGTGSGNLDATVFNAATFEVLISADTDDVNTTTFGLNTPAITGLSGTIILDGVGTGSFTEPLYVFSNRTVQAVGFGNHAQFDLIDVFEMGVGINTYDLTTSFGPIFEASPVFYQFVDVGLDVGNLTFSDMCDITFTATTGPPVLTVNVDLDPNVINLKSRGGWVTAYIEPSGFELTAIDISTIRLAGSAPADPKLARAGDHDANGTPDLMVKFNRQALHPLLTVGQNQLELSGSLVTGQQFKGSDEVRVIHPPEAYPRPMVAPNPLNPAGVLTFNTTVSGPVSIKLFDLHGGLVRTLIEAQPLEVGSHEVGIDGRGEGGRPLASGVYFFRVEAPGGSATGRVAILK